MPTMVSSTRVSQHINAPRGAVHRTLFDPLAVAKGKAPDGMTCCVRTFDGREGGIPDLAHVRLAERHRQDNRARRHLPRPLRAACAREQVVEVDEFETEDPALRRAMTIPITLTGRDGGTDLLAVHRGLPPGVSPADNEEGWRMPLQSSPP
jgi:hypothetical protein